MQHVAKDLIDLARTLIDDDHAEDPQGGWIPGDRWLRFLNWELTELYWRLARLSIIRPTLTETEFVGPSVTIAARAVAAVGQDMGSYIRELANNQARAGSHSIWVPSTPSAAQALEWFAHGSGDEMTIELYPRDAATYKVRFAAPLPYLTANTQLTVDIPAGTEARLVYGMARRALVKESGRSSAIEAGIALADADIGHMASQRKHGDSPRVINSRRRNQLRLAPPELVFG